MTTDSTGGNGAVKGPAPCLALVADDLTGAADAAAAFAGRRFSTLVALTTGAAPPTSVVARFSGGRDLPQNEATRLTRWAIQSLRAHLEPDRWFLKIDSTLRGHPGPELATAMAELGLERALVCPALPTEGRTVVDGRALVAHRSLIGSPAADVAPPVVADRLRGHVVGSIDHLSLDELVDDPSALASRLAALGRGVLVVDALSDRDLRRIAAAALSVGPLLLCGSAGLANGVAAALAERLDARLDAGPPPLRMPVADKPILVVAGSHHPATSRQIDRLAASGALVVRPPRLAPEVDEAELAEHARTLATGLAAGRTTVLTAIGCPDVRLGGAAIADRLARIGGDPRIVEAAGGLVVTGGEAAAAFLRVTGATALHLGGEVQPAVPWGIMDGGTVTGLPVATKAGSFGADETLVDCVAFLLGRRAIEAPDRGPTRPS